ncbi:MAG TPA: hypothetical protein VNO81_13810 [Candidatus Nitrosotenuis sp.]|jgi:type II secretory pathway component PulJ|nr:hypothetical protein [Candidatus Nitrosotenuis sp.]
MWRNRGGATLIEVLVGGGLAVLVLTVLIMFLLAAFKFSGQGTARVEMQQQAVVALERMASELQRSSTEAVALLSRDPLKPQNPVAFALTRLKDVSGEGDPIWEEKLIVYYWDRERSLLLRREWPPAPPTLGLSLSSRRANKVSPADLISLASSTNGTEKLLARGVCSFDVTHAGSGSSIEPPLTLTLGLEREVARQKGPETFQLSRTVTLRN